ncbi:MAG: DUF4190 domain-containing protein [Rhodoglobus sp.]
MTELNGTPAPPPSSAPPVAPPPNYAAAAAPVPGHTLSIVGLILAFISPIIGLVLSIVAKVQAKNAGVKNPLATAGIIVSIIMTIIAIIIVIVAVSLIFSQCAALGPGVHVISGVTYTCG